MTNDNDGAVGAIGAEDPAAVHEEQWCFTWPGKFKGQSGKSRGALLKAAKWDDGSIITVSFLEGSTSIQKKIAKVAQEWVAPGLANLTFSFQDGPNTDIRITFSYPGNWSLLGKTCRTVTDLTKPTMNYASLRNNPTDAEIRRYVLHEFGHALGLIHEHQHPTNGIQWNRPAVIADLSGPPNNWSVPQIEFNLFKPFSENEANSTNSPDFKSIMVYPIPSRWTTNGFTTDLNSKLSDGDKDFIHEMYP